MRKILIAMTLLFGSAIGAVRMYDVEISCASNVWTRPFQTQGATQMVACCADSLLWCDVMICEPSHLVGGNYNYKVQVKNPVSGDAIYEGEIPATDKGWYLARFQLNRDPGVPMVRKGLELELVVTHSAGDSVNIGMAPNAYPYGKLSIPGLANPLGDTWDMAMRLEGINRPASIARQNLRLTSMERLSYN